MTSPTPRLPVVLRFALTLVLGALVAPAPVVAQDAPRDMVFWKVSSPTTTVYLFGSIHVGDQTLYPLPASVEEAFSRSKILAVELNPKNIDQAQALGIVATHGMLPPGDTLAKHIPKETSAALDAYCEANKKAPCAAFARLKPWFVAMTLTMAAAQQAGLDSKLGIDVHFIDEVKPPQRIDELETADFQISLLASASDEEGAQMLASALQTATKLKELLARLQATYLSGDLDALAGLIKEEDGTPDAMRKRLVDDRNVTMAGRVESYLKGTDQAFVVVGALHVIGEKGIAKLLQDRGYRVERVLQGPRKESD